MNLRRLATWSFPLVSSLVTLVVQLVLPRLLIEHMSQGEYTAYVMVMALSSYITLTDGGVRLPVVQEMTRLRASGDLGAFAASTQRALRVFSGLFVLGTSLTLAICWGTLPSIVEVWQAASSRAFVTALCLVIVTDGLAAAIAPIHEGLLAATGRLVLLQSVNFYVTLGRASALIIAVASTRDLSSGLLAVMAVSLSTVIFRFASSAKIYITELRGVQPTRAPRTLLSMVTEGLSLRIGEAFPAAIYPHILSLTAAWVIPFVIPARTYANSCRSVSQNLVSILQLHMTRRVAAGAHSQQRVGLEYDTIATLLVGTHLLLVGLCGAVANQVLTAWIPNVAEGALKCLPWLLLEQCLQALCMPGSILAMANLGLRRWADAQLLGAVAALLVYFCMRSASATDAYALGLAVAALPRAILACYWERRALHAQAAMRAWGAGVAGGLVVAFAANPLLISGAVVLIGCVVTASGLLSARRLLLGPGHATA